MSSGNRSLLGKKISKIDLRNDLEQLLLYLESTTGGMTAANVAALSTIGDTALSDNAEAAVLTLDQRFALVKSSTATPDGITVVATKSGVGRWIRKLTPVPKYTAQTTWYVDPQNALASDENTGLSGSPLKTLAEVSRRLVVADVTNYTVNLLSDTQAGDTWNYNPHWSSTFSNPLSNATFGTVTIQGKQTAVLAGNVVQGSGTTTLGTTPSSNQQAQLNAGFSWATYVGSMVVMKTGTMAGYIAWVLKDLGSNTARISNWWLPGTAPLVGNGTSAALGACPANGDTFDIVSFTKFNGSALHSGNAIRNVTVWNSVAFPSTSVFVVEGCDVRPSMCLFQCSLSPATNRGQAFNGTLRMFGSLYAPTGSPNGVAVFDERFRLVNSAMLNTAVNGQNTGRLEIINSVFQNCPVRCGRSFPGFGGDTSETGGQLAVFAGTYGMGIFDSPTHGLEIVREADVTVDAPLYGSGNTQFGAYVNDGGHLMFRSGQSPTVTGTSGDVQLGGATNVLPGLEASAGGSLPATAAMSTWSAWAASPFNGQAMNHTNGSKILTVAAPV